MTAKHIVAAALAKLPVFIWPLASAIVRCCWPRFRHG